jgi:hypothetical protein
VKINEVYHLAEQESVKRVAGSVKKSEKKKIILDILEREYNIRF